MIQKSENISEQIYLIYNRKSTDDADNQKNSLAYQRMRNLDYAHRENLLLADSLLIQGFCKDGIIDESHSAFKEEDAFVIREDGSVQYRVLRPKFHQLVEMLNSRKIKGVIFLCWDRASRNDQDNLIIKKLIDRGCDIRFAETQYEKSSVGKLHMNIDGMFSGHYSAVISEKVKNAYAKLRAEGKCLYNAPIGYLDKGSDDKPIDSERAPIVKRIFELYATGKWSFNQLGKWASEQGLTKKPVRRKRTHEEILNNVDIEKIPKISRAVDHKTIERILRNPFYIGKIKAGNSYIDSTAHQPLIDTSLFNQVQTILKERNVSVYYIDKPFYTYRGFVFCECGRMYTPYIQKGIVYYRSKCKPNCSNKDSNLNESEITNAIQAILDDMYFTNEELGELEYRAKHELTHISEQRDKTLNNLQVKQRSVIADIDYLTQNKVTLLRTDTMDIDTINQEKQRLEFKLAAINEEINIYSESAAEMLKYVITFSELVKNTGQFFSHALDSEKREVITTVFSKLIFLNRNLKKPLVNKGFDSLLDRSWSTGAPDALFSELYNIYPMVKISINKIQQMLNKFYSNNNSKTVSSPKHP